MRKIITIIISAVLVISSMSGCGQNTGTVSSGIDSGNQFSTPGGNKYKEVVEVSTIRSVGSSVIFKNGDTIDNNIWTKTALEEYNIKIKYLWTVPDAQYAEKLSLMYSTGDLPDYFSVDNSNFEFLYNQGMLQEVGSSVNKYMSAYNTNLLKASDNGTAQTLAQKNGKQYAIVQPAGHEANAYIMWIRQDWLDTLGLDAPKTFDELTNVLKAFYEDDPAGTGKKNYIPLGLSTTSWTGSINGLMNVLGAYKSIWMKKDGQYVYSSIQPEMKEALKQIANYYKLGYISKTYYNAQEGRIAELMGLNRTGVAFANYVSGVPMSDSWKTNKAKWATYPMPAMTEAEYPAPSQCETEADTYWIITKKCQHPDAVVKLMNMFSDKVTNDYHHYGVADDGTTIWHYMTPTIHEPTGNVTCYLDIKAALDSGSTDKLTTLEKARYDNILAYNNGSTDKNDWAMNAIFGKNSALATTYDSYFSKNNYVKNAWAKGQTNTMKEVESQLEVLEQNSFQQIITGEKPIDYFDTFVSEWKRLGGTKITQEVNDSLK